MCPFFSFLFVGLSFFPLPSIHIGLANHSVYGWVFLSFFLSFFLFFFSMAFDLGSETWSCVFFSSSFVFYFLFFIFLRFLLFSSFFPLSLFLYPLLLWSHVWLVHLVVFDTSLFVLTLGGRVVKICK